MWARAFFCSKAGAHVYGIIHDGTQIRAGVFVDKQRVVTTSFDLDAQFNPNAIQIWRLMPHGMELEWTIRPKRWGPSDAVWIDNQTIRFMKNLPIEGYRKAPAILKLSDGKWAVEKRPQRTDRNKKRNNAQEKSPETKTESASQKQSPRQKVLTAEDFVNDYGKNQIDRGSGREEVTLLIEVNPKLPPYRFRLIPDPDALDRWGDDQRVGRVEISKGRSQAILQTVEITTSTGGSRFTQTFEAKDVNFDGYLDIAVLDWSGAKCGGYNYWLFDQRSGRYITNSLTGELKKLSFNDMTLAPKTREIHTTHWLSVCLCKKIYKIVNGHLVLMYVEEPRLKGEGEDYCKVTIKKRINGKMRTIKAIRL